MWQPCPFGTPATHAKSVLPSELKLRLPAGEPCRVSARPGTPAFSLRLSYIDPGSQSRISPFSSPEATVPSGATARLTTLALWPSPRRISEPSLTRQTMGPLLPLVTARAPSGIQPTAVVLLKGLWFRCRCSTTQMLAKTDALVAFPEIK